MNIHLTQDSGYELYANKLKPLVEAILGGKPPAEPHRETETPRRGGTAGASPETGGSQDERQVCGSRVGEGGPLRAGVDEGVRTMKHIVAILAVLLLAPLPRLRAAGDALRDGFVDYIKAAANPDNHGLRADGRFYPYSSPQGRRIGYRQPIADKKLYREGWSAADAERALREQLQAVAAELRVRLRGELKSRI